MPEHLAKAVIDTSIYIPYINKGITHPVIEASSASTIYMSSVVIGELYSGATDVSTIKLLDRLYSTFESLGRLIAPDSHDWQRAGKIISKLGMKYGFEEIFLTRILNDVLIALSARKIGASVITNNKKDFLRIREFLDFEMV